MLQLPSSFFQVYCKLCARHINKIRSKLRGKALKDVFRYVEGTNYVSKYTVARHLDGDSHAAAMDFERLVAGADSDSSEESSTTASTSTSTCGTQQTPSSGPGTQPRIDTMMHKLGREAYEKLIRSANMLAVDGQPLSTFKTLVKCQKSNGVQLISGMDNGHAAREFIHEIANAIREKLALIMCSANAFSVLSDGSQARKTGKEKELVLIRLVRGGIPVYYCVSLADVSSYGDATANNLKVCIDDVFVKKLGLPADKYTNSLVSMTADGASVNFGQYNGLLTQMTQTRPWLLKIHCISHRLELAIKDSILKEKQFSEVKDFMQTIYYLFKQSGKIKHHFEEYGSKVLNATVYIFPKVTGTRFVAHVRRGLRHLLHNWGVLYAVCEDCISSTDPNMRGIKPKLQGVLKKLKNGSFLLSAAMLMQLL
ncbi:Uncharacterised protein at_DN2367, partial [Pycnogonum litorale]